MLIDFLKYKINLYKIILYNMNFFYDIIFKKMFYLGYIVILKSFCIFYFVFLFCIILKWMKF